MKTLADCLESKDNDDLRRLGDFLGLLGRVGLREETQWQEKSETLWENWIKLANPKVLKIMRDFVKLLREAGFLEKIPETKKGGLFVRKYTKSSFSAIKSSGLL